MGSTKQNWMEDEDLEPMHEWIEDNFGNEANCDDESSWNEAIDAYNLYLDKHYEEEAYREAAEDYNYYISLALESADNRFSFEFSNLSLLVTKDNIEIDYMYYRMCYAHAVTLFEVYMEDMAKSLIARDDHFLNNYLRNSKVLSRIPCNLKDLYLNKCSIESKLSIESLRKEALKDVTDRLYHNIDKVIYTFSAILGFDINIDRKSAVKVFQTRHDVVHRNGINKNGKTINIDRNLVLDSIQILLGISSSIRGSVGMLPRN
jgi:hypothetical protein